MKQFLVGVLAIGFLASCNQFQKSKSGMPYKITHGDKKQSLKQGQFLKINIEFKLSKKDSVLNSSYDHIPAYFMYDTAQLGKYNVTEIFPKCFVGDKVEFKLSIDTLAKMGMVQFNPMFTKGSFINGRAEIIASFPTEAAMKADYDKETENEKKKEIALIQEYLKKKGITAQQDPSGVFVVVKTPGEPLKADTGNTASVFYKGYSIIGKKDGLTFDTNLDTARNPKKEPYDVKVGEPGVINGWAHGLKYFGKGGSGTIYVPSMLGYGPQGNPPAIAPYECMAFDMEIANVKPTPKAAPAPAVVPNPAQKH